MKKIAILFLLMLPILLSAQIRPLLPPIDSTSFTFNASDTSNHQIVIASWTHPISTLAIDTTASTLWDVGSTVKPVFSSGIVASTGIMTDTLHPYPPNANDYFILKMDYMIPNPIVNIWHRYQTDSMHAGGVIEFSTDSGSTWVNIAECHSFYTQNIYTTDDTLFSGEPAFTGTTSGEIVSGFQIINCYVIRTTATDCGTAESFWSDDPFYLRFRFISDSTVDSLSGWMIDSIQIINAGCFPGGVASTMGTQHSLSVYPNPAYSDITITASCQIESITITNVIGQTVYANKPTTNQVQVNIADLPLGVYYIKVNGSEVRKFVRQ